MKIMTTSEWCEKMEKEAKNAQEADDYHQLAAVWKKRESEDNNQRKQ